MKRELDDLIGEFSKFVGTFSGWASDKEQELTDAIKKANEELAKLQQKLQNLELGMNVTSAATAAAGPIIGLIAAGATSSPLLPFIIVSSHDSTGLRYINTVSQAGGIIAAAAGLVAIIGLSIAIKSELLTLFQFDV